MTANTPYNTNTQGIPFNAPSHRVASYCQAVFVWERNTEEELSYPYDPTENSLFLKGVQAVGTSSSLNPSSLSDTGRFQKQAVRYGETEYEITIERVLGFESEMFYRVYGNNDPTEYPAQYADDYKENHLLNKKNMGSRGYPVKDGSDYLSLRNYDITILYTPDRFPRVGNAVNRPTFDSNEPELYLSEASDNLNTGDTPTIISSPFRTQDFQPTETTKSKAELEINPVPDTKPITGGFVEDGGIDPLAGSGGSVEDNDRYDVISMTYRNCLISSISYDIGIDGITESIILTSKNLVHNINNSAGGRDPKDIRYYNLPNKEFFSVQANYRYPDNPVYLWKKIEDDPLSANFGKVTTTQYSETNPEEGDAVESLNWYRVKAKSQEGMSVRRHHIDILRDSYGPSSLPTEVSNLFDLEVTYEAEIGTEYTNRTENGQITSPDVTRRRKNLAITSINIELSFNYEELPNIGKRAGSIREKEHEVNRFKYLSLPVEVTCSFEGITRQGLPYWNFLHEYSNLSDPNQADFDSIRNVDNIYTKAAGIKKYNDADMNHLTDWMQPDREIKLVARAIYDSQEKFFLWDLGKRNYLVDISTSGGDTSGGEVTTTLTYTNSYSDAVLTKGDYNESGAGVVIVPYDIDYPSDEPL
jgi:hypothetical protein|tara:strand:- start:7075 stop:9006 length:1932 start_codon:yes stop_codon:yes gene_type:complete